MADVETIGVPHLDRLLPPAPRGSTVLLVNDPGVDGEPFLYQAAHSRLKEGGKVIYVVNTRAPSRVVEAMQTYGFDGATKAGRLLFVDGFSALMGSTEDAAYRLGDPSDLESLAALLEKAAAEHPDAAVMVDDLSTFVDRTSWDAFSRSLPRLVQALRGFRLAEVLFTRWPYAGDVEEAMRTFDAVVSLRGVEERVTFGQYFQVERAQWAGGLSRRPQLYKTVRPGGVFVYIPKVVVTGPFNSGKSTFVRTVSDSAVSVDRLGTTVALDHGRATVDGLIVDVFGTPGQARFDPIIRLVAGQALGVILVVDSTDLDTVSRAREVLDMTWSKGVPCVVAAAKQDLPGCASLEDIKQALRPPEAVPVVACVATERDSTRRVLRTLIDRIMAGAVDQ